MDRGEAGNLLIADYIAKQTGHRTKEDFLREVCRVGNIINEVYDEGDE